MELRKLRNKLFKGKSIYDNKGKLVSRKKGLFRVLENLTEHAGEEIHDLAKDLLKVLIVPALIGLGWYLGGNFERNKQKDYYPGKAVVYEGQLQIDNNYQLLRDPNSNPTNDPNKPTFYDRRDQFKNNP